MSYFVEWRAAAHDRREKIWMSSSDIATCFAPQIGLIICWREIRIWRTQPESEKSEP
jgi:hypothetical protein